MLQIQGGAFPLENKFPRVVENVLGSSEDAPVPISLPTGKLAALESKEIHFSMSLFLFLCMGLYTARVSLASSSSVCHW